MIKDLIYSCYLRKVKETALTAKHQGYTYPSYLKSEIYFICLKETLYEIENNMRKVFDNIDKFEDDFFSIEISTKIIKHKVLRPLDCLKDYWNEIDIIDEIISNDIDELFTSIDLMAYKLQVDERLKLVECIDSDLSAHELIQIKVKLMK